MSEVQWFHRRGELSREGWESVVDSALPGWAHTGIRVAELANTWVTGRATDVERMIVPLAGSFTVSFVEHGEDSTVVLAGRASVFDGPTDVLYVPAGTAVTIVGTGRVAVAESPTTVVRESCHVERADVAVELRGAGQSSRQVHNFGVPGALDAERLIVCEVITPAGNWSSYPAHKHDEHVPGHESRLEEIYYFEAATAKGAVAPSTARPFGLFSTYSSPAGEIDINTQVGSGDIALVPFGYHGPAVAAPGYDLYYLNVMAGPDPERAWRISDDPAHAWVRDTWAGKPIDERLPYGRTDEGR
ncbi:5-deoxy-glucuronate isomerase [Diaminobutyricibacter sp. McL0618]|uniref:5-deoxy-glucuronate isomerase n=1 Tax=Leifsonia sp. McL0618 TaxID=3415677 RepID=UPI003CF4827E